VATLHDTIVGLEEVLAETRAQLADRHDKVLKPYTLVQSAGCKVQGAGFSLLLWG